jgi:heptosyltransferase-2
MRLLLSLPNWLGDAVLATGLLAALSRLERPPAVDVCGNRTALAVAGGHRVVGRAVLYERHGIHARPRPFFALAAALRHSAYAAHLVLPSTPSAALFARTVAATMRVGFDGPGRRLFFTHRVGRGRRGSAHLLDEYRSILAGVAPLIGCDIAVAEPEVEVTAVGTARAASLVGSRPYAVLAPGATFGPTKRWPAGRFAEVGAALAARRGLRLVLVGAEGDAAATGEVGAAIGDREPVVDLTGQTDLETLAAVLARAAIVIANDSGPMHLARAVAAPTVGIFGSTEPAWTGPRGGRVVVAEERPDCAPCYKRRCPIELDCLTGIPTAAVLEAALAELAAAEVAP